MQIRNGSTALNPFITSYPNSKMATHGNLPPSSPNSSVAKLSPLPPKSSFLSQTSTLPSCRCSQFPRIWRALEALEERLSNLEKGIGVPFTKAMPFNFNELEHVPKHIESLSIGITRLEGPVGASFDDMGEAKATKQRGKGEVCPVVNCGKKYGCKKRLRRHIRDASGPGHRIWAKAIARTFCLECNIDLRSINSLRVHNEQSHPEMSACQIEVHRPFMRVIPASFFETLRSASDAEAPIRTVAEESPRSYYSQNAIATPQNKPPLGSTTTGFEFNLDPRGMAARNLSELGFDAPAGFNSAFIHNVDDVEFNIDPHGMATRNLNELSFDAPAGSNSAFTHNTADVEFSIDPHGMATRNLNELGFDAPAGSNSTFTHNAADVEFNIDPHGMATRNLNELGFGAPAGSNSTFTHNAADFEFSIDSHGMATGNPSKFGFSTPAGSNSAFTGNAISFDFNPGGCGNPSINQRSCFLSGREEWQ